MNSVQAESSGSQLLRQAASVFLETYKGIKGSSIIFQYFLEDSEYVRVEHEMEGSDDDFAHRIAVALLKQDHIEGNVIPYSFEKMVEMADNPCGEYTSKIEQRLERGETRWGGHHLLELVYKRMAVEVVINNQTVPQFSKDVLAALLASDLIKELKIAFDISSDSVEERSFSACPYDIGYRVHEYQTFGEGGSILSNHGGLTKNYSTISIIRPIIPDDSFLAVYEYMDMFSDITLHFIKLVPGDSLGKYIFVEHVVSDIPKEKKEGRIFYEYTNYNLMHGYSWYFPSSCLSSSGLSELCHEHNQGSELFNLDGLNHFVSGTGARVAQTGVYSGSSEVTLTIRREAPSPPMVQQSQVGMDLKLATMVQLLARCFGANPKGPCYSPKFDHQRSNLERLSTLSTHQSFWDCAHSLRTNDYLQCEYTGSDRPSPSRPARER